MCLKFANFTVVKKDEDLIISRGLFEKHQLTIPLERIQAVKISENPIREPLGYATVHLLSAGGSLNNQNMSAVLFPLIKKAKIAEVLKEFAPDYTMQEQLTPLSKRAKRGYLLIYTIPFVILSCIIGYFFEPWGYLAFLTIPAALAAGLAAFRAGGWNTRGDQLTLVSRAVVKTTYLAKRKRIQVLECKQSYFQKRLELASLQASATSGFGGTHFHVKGVDLKDAGEMFEWYSYEKAQEKTPSFNGTASCCKRIKRMQLTPRPLQKRGAIRAPPTAPKIWAIMLMFVLMKVITMPIAKIVIISCEFDESIRSFRKTTMYR